MASASSRHSSSRLGPSAVAGNGAPARIPCNVARNIGVRRSSSAQSASSPEVAGSSCVGRIAAIRNLAVAFGASAATARARLVALLLRGNDVVGMLVVRRRTPGAFPQNTVDLIKTFAAQSVLAVLNARLFKNVEARTGELVKSLQDLRTAQDPLGPD